MQAERKRDLQKAEIIKKHAEALARIEEGWKIQVDQMRTQMSACHSALASLGLTVSSDSDAINGAWIAFAVS